VSMSLRILCATVFSAGVLVGCSHTPQSHYYYPKLLSYESPELLPGYSVDMGLLSYDYSEQHKSIDVSEDSIGNFSAQNVDDDDNTGRSYTLNHIQFSVTSDMDFAYLWGGGMRARYGILNQGGVGEPGWKASAGFSYYPRDSYSRKYTAEGGQAIYERYRSYGHKASVNIGTRLTKSFIVYMNSFYSYFEDTAMMQIDASPIVLAEVNNRNYGSLFGARWDFVGSSKQYLGFYLSVETGVVRLRYDTGYDEITHPVGLNIGGYIR